MRCCVFFIAILSFSACAAMPRTHPLQEFPLNQGDTLLWYGSSSTMIGVWPRTLEFLFRTRHPELALKFEKRGVGGGSFDKALKEIDSVLEKNRPSVVFFNFGGNDATKGEKGLPAFRTVMAEIVSKVHAVGARVILLTPQPGDERLAGKRNDFLGVYSRAMLEFAREKGLAALNTYEPLEDMLNFMQNDVSQYTINKDLIHLTDSAYVAWGFFIYDGLNAPVVESSAELSANGRITRVERCLISDVRNHGERLQFTREDEILPFLPPDPLPVTSNTAPTKHLIPPPSPVLQYAYDHWSDLPPRVYCPLEKHSRYMLKVSGLDAGNYEVRVNQKPVGVATEQQLNEGVNLNSLLLTSGHPAPWAELALDLWRGKKLEKVGRTKFNFEIRRVSEK